MPKPRKRSFPRFLTGLLSLAVLFGACGQPAQPDMTPITVQLLWTHQAQFAGFYAADQKGYYAAEGLAVTFSQGGFGVDKLASVLDGTARFGVAGADELILARSQGEPLRAIATIYRRSPVVFISLAQKGITRPQDFAGQTIRAPANTIPSLRALTAQVGLAPDQYTIVDLPSDLAVFASGDVAVWGVYSTSFALAARQAGYKLNTIYPDDYGVHFYADTIFTTDAMIAENPDMVMRFLRATIKGWTYAVENSSEVPAMVQKMQPAADAGVELARMTASIPLVNTGTDQIGWMKPEIWAGIEKTLRAQGVLSAPLDVSQVYSMRFIEGVYGK